MRDLLERKGFGYLLAFAVFYKLGFNIATAMFVNPRLGAAGNTLMGPGSLKIRNAFGNGNASTGFDTAVSYHQRHRYTP